VADSLTEQVLQAVVAALDGAGKPAGVTVNRSRRQSIEKDDLPMISVYPIGEEVTRATDNRRSPVVERRLRVEVKCRVVGDDQANDALRKWAVQSVMADQSLGGLALEIVEESTDWDADDATDADYSVAAVDFVVRYTTSRFNLENKA
jgi:hypothetical protein